MATKGKRNGPRAHTFFVTVREQFPMTDEEVLHKVASWLDHNGHTSVASGFDFHAVSMGTSMHRTIERTPS